MGTTVAMLKAFTCVHKHGAIVSIKVWITNQIHLSSKLEDLTSFNKLSIGRTEES